MNLLAALLLCLFISSHSIIKVPGVNQENKKTENVLASVDRKPEAKKYEFKTSGPTISPKKTKPSPTPVISRKLTPTPTKLVISPTLTTTPIATKTPTLTLALTITPTSQASSTPSITSLVQLSGRTDYIMNEINNYRASLGLFKLQTNSSVCDFASVRARELASNFNHDGFNNRLNNKTLPYPSYSFITENIAMNSDYKNVAKSWINSAGHAANLQKDTLYACVGNFGDYYSYEGWKP